MHELRKSAVHPPRKLGVYDQRKFCNLPPYSPDLNPDELVWNHLKTHTVGRMAMTDKRAFKSKVIGSMRALQKNRHKVASFFQKDGLKYAA